jgi:hypothetical protein
MSAFRNFGDWTFGIFLVIFLRMIGMILRRGLFGVGIVLLLLLPGICDEIDHSIGVGKGFIGVFIIHMLMISIRSLYIEVISPCIVFCVAFFLLLLSLSSLFLSHQSEIYAHQPVPRVHLITPSIPFPHTITPTHHHFTARPPLRHASRNNSRPLSHRTAYISIHYHYHHVIVIDIMAGLENAFCVLIGKQFPLVQVDQSDCALYSTVHFDNVNVNVRGIKLDWVGWLRFFGFDLC